MRQRRFARAVAVDDWQENVARPVLLVPHVSFFLEQAKHRAYRGITRWVGNVFEHLGGRCATASIDDVHDLSLAATQPRSAFGHAHPHYAKKIAATGKLAE